MPELPEPTQADVTALAAVITKAAESGIRYGHWTLARHILAAGYRLASEPDPVLHGECLTCQKVVPLVRDHVAEHPGSGDQPCTGSGLYPFRIVQGGGPGA